jgi:hypothetical protein
MTPSLLLAMFAVGPPVTLDLSRLERALPAGPKYVTAGPRYCLLVFGPEARTRVWLVHDGDTMHVLASPDGKAAPRWRQVRRLYNTFALGDVHDGAGKVRYRALRYFMNPQYPRLFVMIDGKRQQAGLDRRGKLAFAPSAKEAPVIHFDGPLTLDLFHEQEPLMTGRNVDISAVVGTPGVGAGTFATLFVTAYPRNAWPVADIEYPAKDGGKPILAKVRLAED